MRQIPAPAPSDGHRRARRAVAVRRGPPDRPRAPADRAAGPRVGPGAGPRRRHRRADRDRGRGARRGPGRPPLAAGVVGGPRLEILEMGAPRACARLDASLRSGWSRRCACCSSYLDAMGVLTAGHPWSSSRQRSRPGAAPGRPGSHRRVGAPPSGRERTTMKGLREPAPERDGASSCAATGEGHSSGERLTTGAAEIPTSPIRTSRPSGDT